MTARQLSVLGAIKHLGNGCRQREIIKYLTMNPPHCSMRITELEQMGLVVTDNTGGFPTHSLTDAGMKELDRGDDLICDGQPWINPLWEVHAIHKQSLRKKVGRRNAS